MISKSVACAGEQLSTLNTDLDRIASVFAGANAHHRDSMLEVGGLCAEFIQRGITGGVSAHALRIMLTNRLSREAGRKINVGRLTADYYVATLLGNGDCGNLPLRTVTQFALFIKHNLKTEVWGITPGFEERGPALFVEAREGQWNRDRSHEAVRECFPEDQPRYRSKFAKKESAVIRRKEVDEVRADAAVFPIKVASAGDVVEHLANMIRQSHDPREVAMMLQAKLQTILR